jgi:hypothetical protein
MSLYSVTSCLGFYLTVTFRFHGCAGLPGCCDGCGHIQAVGEKTNAYAHLLNWLE